MEVIVPAVNEVEALIIEPVMLVADKLEIPAIVVAVPPKEIPVVPTVIALLAKWPFWILPYIITAVTDVPAVVVKSI